MPKPDIPGRDDILRFVADTPGRVGKREIARAFGVKGGDRIGLKSLLAEMADEGLLARAGKRLARPGELPRVTLLSVAGRNEDGELIAEPTSWEFEGPRPRVRLTGSGPAPGMGDRLLARIAYEPDGQATGRVIKVIERRPAATLAVLERIGDRPQLTPISRKDREVLFLDPGAAADIPDKTLVRIEVDRGRARIVEVVGPAGSEQAVSLLAIHAHGIPNRFPDRVLAEAEAAEPASLRGREDWRAIPFVTIDPPDAKDHDDAVYAEPDPHNEGGQVVIVAIADVAHYVTAGSAMDREAVLRGNSTYFPDRVVPMLPEAISNDLCSLRQGEARAALAVRMVFSRDGRKTGHTFHRVLMRSARKLAYAEAQAIADAIALNEGPVADSIALDKEPIADAIVLDKGPVADAIAPDKGPLADAIAPDKKPVAGAIALDNASPELEPNADAIDEVLRGEYPVAGAAGPDIAALVAALWEAYALLKQGRDGREPLDLDLPERKIVLTPEGRVARVTVPERLDAHRLIEEFMIQANVAAAESCEAARIPLLYRVHDQPSLEKLDALREFLATLEIRLAKGTRLRPEHFNGILAKVAGSANAQLVNEVVLRSQAQAAYAPDNIGHFGLNLRRYAHFTSPIRRYADLVVHRALIRAERLGDDGLTDAEIEALPATAEQISLTERRSMIAERETIDRLIATFLFEHIGATFEGRIGGVTKAGLFIRLNDTGADGFCPISTLANEYMLYDETGHALVGQTSGVVFRLGDDVTVRLVEAAPYSGAMRFEIVDHGSSGAGRRTPKRPSQAARPRPGQFKRGRR